MTKRRRRGSGKKRFECAHRGKGMYCHRCQQADIIEKMAKRGTPLVDHKKEHHKKPHKWAIEDMYNEAKRLRSTGKIY